jgi:uncharacterized membrane protein
MLCMEVSIIVYKVCKSSVSVNDLHLHVQIFTITFILLQWIYIFFTLTHEASVNICQIHLHSPM